MLTFSSILIKTSRPLSCIFIADVCYMGRVLFCCMFFQGTNVASGKARGVVIGTGQNTEIGRIECFIILLNRHITH